MSLDIEEQQVAIDFFDDPEFRWHHRVLLRRLDGSNWVVATPTLEVETSDLSLHRVVPIGRNTDFPDRVVDELFAFDQELDPADLARLRGQAADLAAVLGAPGARAAEGPVDAEWLFADTARAHFGDLVPDMVMGSPATSVVRNSAGLALVDVDGEQEWVLVERVLRADKEDWLREKRSGPGRDPRLAGLKLDDQGRRSLTLREASALYAVGTQKDWPFAGPRASTELARGIVAGGTEASQFHQLWVPKSGVAERSAVAQEHRVALQIFHLMATYDQYNLANSASAKLLARNILRIQRAVRRSPKSPDFSGLEAMTLHNFDESGGVLCLEFDKHVAEQQKAQANILKQSRLWKEEQDAEEKRKPTK